MLGLRRGLILLWLLGASPALGAQALPDLRVLSAAIVPGQPAVAFEVVNAGPGTSLPGAVAVVSSRLSRSVGRLPLPPLRPGERRRLVIALPVDGDLLPPGTRPDGTEVALDIRYPGPEMDPRNRFTFIIGQPAAQTQLFQALPQLLQPLLPPSPPAQDGQSTMAMMDLGIALSSLFPEGAQLFRKSGDIFLTADAAVDPAAGDQSEDFHWDVSRVPGAKGVLWQVSRAVFPPFAAGGANDRSPQGLMLSGYAAGKTGSFTVDFLPLARELGLAPKRGAVASIGRSLQAVAVLPQAGGGGTSSTARMLAVKSADKDPIAAYFALGRSFAFHVRAVPSAGQRSDIVGKPSNVMRTYYGTPPAAEPVTIFTSRSVPAPKLVLDRFEYRHFAYDERWPPGCKEWQPPADEAWYEKAFHFLTDAWNWLAESYGKV